jgi:hypothetical protein
MSPPASSLAATDAAVVTQIVAVVRNALGMAMERQGSGGARQSMPLKLAIGPRPAFHKSGIGLHRSPESCRKLVQVGLLRPSTRRHAPPNCAGDRPVTSTPPASAAPSAVRRRFQEGHDPFGPRSPGEPGFATGRNWRRWRPLAEAREHLRRAPEHSHSWPSMRVRAGIDAADPC